jgi:ubiquitin carboxyl-terminal hydrolase 48
MFSEEWSATPGKGIYAEIAFRKSVQDKLHGSYEAMSIMNGDLDHLGVREPYLKTDPEVSKLLGCTVT